MYYIWFDLNGKMYSILSDQELKLLGIKDPQNTYLPPGKINSRTREYLRKRPNSLNEYKIIVASIRNEKKQEENNNN